ncbi:unnamed protein product [Cylindrotheca closterium]|uniref:SET domain-containing protein n=1 Tax=Cylindrotheca closterium TaxID=2856 RepID=A0AAD2CSI0_9STRA|nr:unnamed protein product [Cylindrotheca closterium]
MVAPETEEDDDMLCQLLHAVWKEIELGEASTYAPYIGYLQASQSDREMIPVLWSNIGRRLLNMVSITLPRKHITTWIDGFDNCFDALKKSDNSSCDVPDTENCKAPDLDDKDDDQHQDMDEEQEIAEDGSLITHDVDAIENSEEQKAHLKAFDIAIQHQIDRRFLVPLYDQIQHHHVEYNVNHTIQGDYSVKVVALKDIAKGEQLQRQTLTCLSECDGSKKDTVTSVMRNHGQVQNHPHFWNFPVGVSFAYDPSNKDEPIQWVKKPFELWNVEIMENEYSRQLRVRAGEINQSRQSIPDAEWKQIDAYSHALISALQVSVADAYEMFDEDGNIKEAMLKEQEEEKEKEGNEGDDQGDEGEETEEGEHTGDGEGEEEEFEELFEEQMDGESDEWYCDNSCFENGVPTNASGCDEAECFLGDIADLRGCPDYRYNAILNETEWVLMRSAYIAIVGPKKATVNLTYWSGMKVPFRVGYSPGRGRGVFSVEDIPKGTLVWTSEHTAAFETGIQYRQFLRALPDFMVCDLLIWCYTAKDISDVHYIGCDLDEGSLFNTYDDRAEYNIGGLKGTKVDFKANELVYALRDITAGEELVTAYGSFDTDDFAAFDL